MPNRRVSSVLKTMVTGGLVITGDRALLAKGLELQELAHYPCQ